MQLFRKKTNMSLLEVKQFMRYFHTYGKANIPSRYGFLREEYLLLKQEAELGNVAILELS